MLLEPGQMDYRQVRCHPRDALDRVDAGKVRRPVDKYPRPTQRYRLTDRFTPDEINQLVARYQAGEMSISLAREHRIAKSAFLALHGSWGNEALE